MNLSRGDEFALSTLMVLPNNEISIDTTECDYKNEPFIAILNDCLPFLSDQDLSLIAEDIQDFVFGFDKNVENTNLFNRYPGAKLVLSVFRRVFRDTVSEYQKNNLIVEGKPMDPHEQQLCVREMVRGFITILYQRLPCYTAGLDIDLITALSATPYESKSPNGESIAILPSLSWLKRNAVVEFEPLDGIDLEQPQLRALRKQLSICGDGALAICKDDNTGIYKTVGLISQETAQKLPRFRFQKHAEWVFAVADSDGKNHDRVRYCNGTLMLPVFDLQDIYKKKLYSLPINNESREQLASIINATNECKHGAILIIAEKTVIQKEVTRLASIKRGTRLVPPVPLVQNEEVSPILKQFSAMDGAIFLDFDGTCHAFGVILDGIVSNMGNNARGSRYNSTKAYTEWVRETKYPGTSVWGVVKSEDGMIDIFDETKGTKDVGKSQRIRRVLKKFSKLTIDILGHLW